MAEKKPSYWEQLRDPRWQQKRLRVMERDGWECQSCGQKDKTLNVHHMYYERGLAPWEYPDATLHTLCEGCHEFIQGRLTELHRAIGRSDWSSIEHALGYLRGQYGREGPGIEVVIDSAECAYGVAIAWAINPDDVERIAREGGGRVVSDQLSELYRAAREARKVKET